jgi:hypothetical protein
MIVGRLRCWLKCGRAGRPCDQMLRTLQPGNSWPGQVRNLPRAPLALVIESVLICGHDASPLISLYTAISHTVRRGKIRTEGASNAHRAVHPLLHRRLLS